MQLKTGNKITMRLCHALLSHKVCFVQEKQKQENEQERVQINPGYNRSINLYSLCGAKYSRIDQVKFVEDRKFYLVYIFLNTSSHMSLIYTHSYCTLEAVTKTYPLKKVFT